MEARSVYNFVSRRVSPPSSPVMIDPRPPVSDGLEAEPGHHDRNFSRLRNSIRRRSFCVHQSVEKKLLQMAEGHYDLPTIGPSGILYHVLDLPGDHSPETVVNVINQSMEWLRENSAKSLSSYNQSPVNGSFETLPDLLDLEMECVQSPSLPGLPSDSQSRGKFADPFSLGILTKPTGVSSDTYTQQDSRSSTPVELCSKDKFHRGCTPLMSPDSTRSVIPHLPPLSPLVEVSAATTQNEVMKAEAVPSVPDGIDISQNAILPPSLLPGTSKIRRKPVYLESSNRTVITPLGSSTSYLGVGLRPIVQPTPTPIPTLLLTPAPPVTARESREVLERQRKVQYICTDGQAQRRLSQTWNARNHGQLNTSRSIGKRVNSTMLHTIDEHVAEEIHIPGSNSVAEKISRFEKPLPPLPAEALEPKVAPKPKNKRSFLGSLLRRRSWNREADSGTSTNSVSCGDSEPNHPTPPVAGDVNPAPVYLTSQPSRSLFLEETRPENPSSSERDNPLKSSSQHKDNYLPYVPYSPTFLDSTSLEQSGGRVNQLRKQFEHQENGASSMSPTVSQAQEILGLRRTSNPTDDFEDTLKSTSFCTDADSEITLQAHSRTPSSSSDVTAAASVDDADDFHDVESNSSMPTVASRQEWEWKRWVDDEWNERHRRRRSYVRKDKSPSRLEEE